jgi:hypothetical protein
MNLNETLIVNDPVKEIFIVGGNIQGFKGDQGIQGLKGDQGIQGLKGDQGIQGLKGDTGIQGEQGIQGLKGDQGIQGLKGDTGSGIYAHCRTRNDGILEYSINLNVNRTSIGSYEYTFLTPLPNSDYSVVATPNLIIGSDPNMFVSNLTNNGFTLISAIGDNGTTNDVFEDVPHSVAVFSKAGGPDGLTNTYDIWLGQGNYGTIQEFLNTLVGPKGDPGSSVGISYNYEESLNLTTVTNSTFNNKVILTENLSTSDYKIGWCYGCGGEEKSQINVQGTVDNVILFEHIQEFRHAINNDIRPHSIFRKVSFTQGNHTIILRFKSLDRDVYLSNAAIELIKLT